MLFMNAFVNEWLVEYGSIDSASAEAVQVKGLAWTAVAPNGIDREKASVRKCFFMKRTPVGLGMRGNAATSAAPCCQQEAANLVNQRRRMLYTIVTVSGHIVYPRSGVPLHSGPPA